MPWNIVNCKTKLGKFILPNYVYTIGRLEGDIIVNDKSVSRSHAKIFFVPDKLTICVEDLSKFGTFINSTSLINKRGFIRHGDIVTFGAQPGVNFQCSFIQFDLIMSTLTQSDKAKLYEYANSVGGGLMNEWNDSVGYLVMSNLKVTYKVICALIKQIPIVTTEFIKEMHDYFLGKRLNEPIIDDFLPPTADANIVDKNISFKPNINRRTLFADKTFYFLTVKKQCHLELAITSAGGKIVLLSDSNFNQSLTMEQLSDPNSIVMYEASETSLVKEVFIILKQLGKRPIIDSEIGFAVLHVTTDDYCNPTKTCTANIYAETHLTQILTVNPFHMDSKPQVATGDSHQQLTFKRLFNEKENSKPISENVSKKRKVSLSKANLSSEVTQKINEPLQFNTVTQFSKTKEVQESKNEIERKRNVTVSELYAAKNNDNMKDFFKDNSFPPSSKLNSSKRNNCAIDDFDAEFDQIQIPNLNPMAIGVNEGICKRRDESKPDKSQILDPKSKNMEREVEVTKRAEFSNHPIKLVAANTVHRKPLESSTDPATNSLPKSDCKLTKFESLLVVNLVKPPQANINFKTFRKVSRAYINLNPLGLEVFNRKNY